MADKQFNITNNSPNYTKNNNINNINYVKRNGAGWSWFKTIFIACMLTIFSVVCFAGGKDAIPQGYTNSIRQETIKTLIGYEPINDDEIFNNITIDTITDYTFSLKNSFSLPDDYYTPNYSMSYNDIVGLNSILGGVDVPVFNIDTDLDTGYTYLYGYYSRANSTFYFPLNFQITNFKPSLIIASRVRYPQGFTNSHYDYILEADDHSKLLYKKAGGNWTYFNMKFTSNYVSYYKSLYGSNNNVFNKMVEFLSYSCNVSSDNVPMKPVYSEYNIKYATYDWNIKLTQLSKLKNVFTPLFSSNIPDEETTLQKGFDQFQEFIDLGVLTYTGDKITPNRKMSENWEYNVNISSFIKFDEMIHLLNSNLGKYINANYWYDSSTRKFVRFDTNIIYGSINDTNTTLKNVINLLSYPITTGFNITYNIGVLFTFIFVW